MTAEAGLPFFCCGPSVPDYSHAGITLVPASLSLPQFIQYIRSFSLDELERVVGDGILVVVYHQFDFWGDNRPPTASPEDFFEIMIEIDRRRIPVVVLTPRLSSSSFSHTTDPFFDAQRHILRKWRQDSKQRSASWLTSRMGVQSVRILRDAKRSMIQTVRRLDVPLKRLGRKVAAGTPDIDSAFRGATHPRVPHLRISRPLRGDG